MFSYGNAWPGLTFSKVRGRWGHFFATGASPRSWTTKLAMSPSVHGGQYDTKHVTFEKMVQPSFVGEKKSIFNLNQLVETSIPLRHSPSGKRALDNSW